MRVGQIFMNLIKCPTCGKLVPIRFPIYTCKSSKKGGLPPCADLKPGEFVVLRNGRCFKVMRTSERYVWIRCNLDGGIKAGGTEEWRRYTRPNLQKALAEDL